MRIIASVLIALGLGFIAINIGHPAPAADQAPPTGAVADVVSIFIVPLSSFLLAGLLIVSQRIPRFMATFMATLAVAHILLVLLLIAGAFDCVPFGWGDYVPPPMMAIAASIAGALIYAASFIPVIRTIMQIGDRYYRAEEVGVLSFGPFGAIRAKEGNIGVFLLAVIIAINLVQVALSVRLNFFSRDMFNALQTKDASAFWYQILFIFVIFAAIWVVSGLTELMTQYVLTIRWRTYLNNYYVRHWLGGGLHYEMQVKDGQTDNPDQRIANDLRDFVGVAGSADGTLGLSIQLLNQMATLVSFITILWGLSAHMTLPYTATEVPGLLVWVAILYATFGTVAIHLIGRPLIGLNFRQERVEADYRFSLARIREYGEQIALLKGEHAETERLNGRFSFVAGNYLAIAWRMMKITAFSFSFRQANVIFPYLLVAPYFFLGKVSLGQMQQTVGAFSEVQAAFNFFILAYTTLAAYKAVIDRLTSFESAMNRSEEDLAAHPPALIETGAGSDIVLEDVSVRLPDGKVLMGDVDLDLRKGEALLIAGPSGAGKSTLFRTIAGIWPFSSGRITVPQGESVMELPQRPYVPQGSLRDAVTYPAVAGAYPDEAIRAALRAAKLDHFSDQLDDKRLWSQTLSLGEQQRLAVARALLARPDWLLLDEATAALDEETEAGIYAAIKASLPATTIVSIGHRSTLKAFHDRRMELHKSENGDHVWREAAAAS